MARTDQYVCKQKDGLDLENGWFWPGKKEFLKILDERYPDDDQVQEFLRRVRT